VKLAVEFPSVAYRDGPETVLSLAREVERIGYDQLDMFDHVVMGYPTATRAAPMYPPRMPILEALMTLAFVAAATSRIGLGTEVLVLPQRQPTLVAKQVSTLDTLSGGRVRLGVGVGWQAAEYEALGETFSSRGRRMDDAIRVLRQCWADEQIDFTSEHYRLDHVAMEPKPPQGAKLPVWIGGHSEAALRRVGELGDGWLATSRMTDGQARSARATILQVAETAGRDPAAIGFQMMLDTPITDDAGRGFYADMDRVARAAARIADLGFDWATVNMTSIFQSGARTPGAIIDCLGRIHDRIQQECNAGAAT
jgi:probable F420-dependent oxidoreductase